MYNKGQINCLVLGNECVEMRFSELGECNHSSAAGVQTLERVTKNLAINTSLNTSCRSELQRAKAGEDDRSNTREARYHSSTPMFLRVRICRGFRSAWPLEPVKDSDATFLRSV